MTYDLTLRVKELDGKVFLIEDGDKGTSFGHIRGVHLWANTTYLGLVTPSSGIQSFFNVKSHEIKHDTSPNGEYSEDYLRISFEIRALEKAP